MFEGSTRTLLCGDLFTQFGDKSLSLGGDIVGPAIMAEDTLRYSALSPGMGKTIRDLSELRPQALALMHGPSYVGDAAKALVELGEDHDRRTRVVMEQLADSKTDRD